MPFRREDRFAALPGRDVIRWPRRAKGRLAAQVPPGAPAPNCFTVLELEPNPSSELILLPWLDSRSAQRRVSRSATPEFSDGDYVVVVRYLTPAWRRAIEGARDRLAGVAYFMDDDLWDRAAWEGLPPACPRRLDMRALRQVGPSPLLPTPFNATRGPVKFCDFARMGAVGVYGDVVPFAGFVRDGVDGLLLPNEPARWIEALVALVNDAPRRSAIAAAARVRALSGA